jgi:hypothetical protein
MSMVSIDAFVFPTAYSGYAAGFARSPGGRLFVGRRWSSLQDRDMSNLRLGIARVHSHCVRKLHDLPAHGRSVMIYVMARRFRCLNVTCRRKIFAERLDDAGAFARRTKRPGSLQRHLGLGSVRNSRLGESA